MKKTLRDQNIALRRYEKRVQTLALSNGILTQLSRWVAAVGKKEQGTEEALFGDDSAVDASYIMEARSLREDLPPLDLATIKDFLRFIVATSRGIIDDGQKKGNFISGPGIPWSDREQEKAEALVRGKGAGPFHQYTLDCRRRPIHPSTQQSSNSLRNRSLLLDRSKNRRLLP